ncbi:fused MFS/spermidine synthase [Flavobacterium sp.]|uniref:spermidine synthase n=1 Tax=Flavobacterium sp. TaxID=239 RepID=UPI0033418956
MMMFKKILSYFYPITIYKETSTISKTIEVTLYNGKMLLNTKNTNYSFGSLQSILKKGLLYIGSAEINRMESVLILGVAGGSVVQTLVNDFSFSKNILGVELDAEIIHIANSYFNLDKIPNFKCVIADAEKFVQSDASQYDLIIIDIFKDTEMPEFLFQDSFISNSKQLLNKNGYILFNTMHLNRNSKNTIDQYLMHFDSNSYSKKVLKNVEKYNDVIIIKRV